jgi:NADH-quinone oxidoreductase subunit H
MELISRPIFNFLIFPGLCFAAILGLFASWLERKITALVQWRVGPPWYQPYLDILKLCSKELLIPKQAGRVAFLLSPVLGLVGVTLVCDILGLNIASVRNSFLGDIIVVLYLLLLPSVAIILGGFASANPLAALGAARESKLILAYELPFLLTVFIAVIKSGMTIKIGEIILSQSAKLHVASFSGVIAFVVGLLCLQAKVGLGPFDVAEAETEIMGGALTEYSGLALGFFKLTKAMMLYAATLFLSVLFLGGFSFAGWQIFWSALKYILIILAMSLIKNTNPRVRIDQAVGFFWGKLTILAIIGVVLAFLGK